MTFYDKFDKLCADNGEKKTPLCIELGLSKTAWIRWRDGSIPEKKTLKRIAEHFNVPVSYLVDDSMEEVPEAAEETETERIRKMMRDRPGIRLLFDVLEDAPDSDLYETLAVAQRLKEKSKR